MLAVLVEHLTNNLEKAIKNLTKAYDEQNKPLNVKIASYASLRKKTRKSNFIDLATSSFIKSYPLFLNVQERMFVFIDARVYYNSGRYLNP